MPRRVPDPQSPLSLLPPSEMVRVVGRIKGAEIECHPNPEEIDHLWIRVDAGGEVLISVNTSSKRNRLAGFDERIRVGVIREKWATLPSPGASVCVSNDYGEVEARANVFFEHYDRAPLEGLLLDRCRKACLLEVWGAPYRRRTQGVHQVHSRRASCAVSEDLRGRDGALKFYYQTGQEAELFLFKFCGQP